MICVYIFLRLPDFFTYLSLECDLELEFDLFSMLILGLPNLDAPFFIFCIFDHAKVFLVFLLFVSPY